MKKTYNQYTVEADRNEADGTNFIRVTVTADPVRTENHPWPEDAETEEEAIDMTIEWLEESEA